MEVKNEMTRKVVIILVTMITISLNVGFFLAQYTKNQKMSFLGEG